MQLIWLLPSIGFGLYLGFANHQWVPAIMALAMAILMALFTFTTSRRAALDTTAPIHWGVKRVAIGNQVQPRFSVFWKPESRKFLVEQAIQENRLGLAEILSEQKVQRDLRAQNVSPSGLSFWCGLDGSNLLDLDFVTHGPHALITGATGSGKSQLLKLILGSLIATYQESQLELVLIDFKGGAGLREFRARSRNFTTDLDANVDELIQQLQVWLFEREQLFAKLSISRIEEHQSLSRMLIVVDEFSIFIKCKGALEALEAIAARGRSLGMHLLIASQSCSSVPRTLLTNLSLRFALGNLDPVEAAQLGIKLQSKNLHQAPATSNSQIHASFVGTGVGGGFVFPVLTQLPKGILEKPNLEQSMHPTNISSVEVASRQPKNEIRLI